MASFNSRKLSGIPCLIPEGVVIVPEMQGKGIFKRFVDFVINGQALICLRTQNPRMYRALQKYCCSIYPGEEETPEAISAIIKDFAKFSNCEIDSNSVVKGYYGGLFYGETPHHQKIDPLFKKLGVDLDKGDGLLIAGVI